MKKIKSILAVLLGFSVAFSAVSHQKMDEEVLVAKLRDKALKSTLGYDILESLTTEVGPRMAGTIQDEMAVKWGVAKFKSLGRHNHFTRYFSDCSRCFNCDIYDRGDKQYRDDSFVNAYFSSCSY